MYDEAEMSRQDDILMAYMSRWCMWLWTGAACVSCRERRKSHLITSTTHNFFFFSHIHSYSVYLDAFPKNTLLSTSPLDIPRTGKKRTDFSFLKNYFPSSPLPTATLLSSVPLPCFFFFFERQARWVQYLFSLVKAVQPLEKTSPCR